MADPLCHAAQGSLMLVVPFIRLIRSKITLVWLAVTGAILGDLPDILGVFGYFVLHDHGGLYFSAHFGAIRNVIHYVPMCWLHLFIDSYTHELADRRSIANEWIIIELAAWVVNIGLILWMVRVLRRQLLRSQESNPKAYRLSSKDSVAL